MVLLPTRRNLSLKNQKFFKIYYKIYYKEIYKIFKNTLADLLAFHQFIEKIFSQSLFSNFLVKKRIYIFWQFLSRESISAVPFFIITEINGRHQKLLPFSLILFNSIHFSFFSNIDIH